MPHRAALYSVRIRRSQQRETYKLLGNYDDASTWLGDTLNAILPTLKVNDTDKDIGVTFESMLHSLPAHCIGVTLLGGRSGISSVIQRTGDAPFYRTPDHSELMRSAILFDLPPSRNIGFAIVHVPHRNSRKSLIDKYLSTYFSNLGYSLEIAPIVPQDALRQAVDDNAIERVTLIKRDLWSDNAFANAAQWGDNEVGRIELSIPSRRNHKLRRDPLRRFLDDQTAENRRQIVEFAGLRFDEAKVTVRMPGGSRRTFYLEDHEGGHPMSVEIDIHSEDTLGARPDDLRHELQSALAQMHPSP